MRNKIERRKRFLMIVPLLFIEMFYSAVVIDLFRQQTVKSLIAASLLSIAFFIGNYYIIIFLIKPFKSKK